MYHNERSMRGFTLLETVVALAILALSLTVIYQSIGWTLRHGAEQRQRDLAWLTAQSVLDELRDLHTLTPGHRNGSTAQGLTWEAVISPYTPKPDTDPAPFGAQETHGLTAVQVDVTVSWGERAGRRIELRSVELAAVPQS